MKRWVRWTEGKAANEPKPQRRRVKETQKKGEKKKLINW